MNLFLTKVLSAIALPFFLIGSFFHSQVDNRVPNQLGAVIPTAIALFETSLASSITNSATTMTLVSATTKDGTLLATSTYGFIIDEGTASEEFVTATCGGTNCTGMVRGISVVSGTSSVAALAMGHRRGASVKITNAPLELVMAHILNGQESIPNRLYYDSNPCTAGSASTSICSKAYSDALIAQGAATSTNTTAGITFLSVAAANANIPIAVGDNDTRLPTQSENDALAGTSPSGSNKYITFLDTATTSAVSKVVMSSSTNGQIDPSFIASSTASSTTYTNSIFSTSSQPVRTFASSTFQSFYQNTTTKTLVVTINGSCTPTSSNGSANYTAYLNSSATTTNAINLGSYGLTGTGAISGTVPSFSFTIPIIVPSNYYYEIFYANTSASCSITKWTEYSF